MRKTEYSDKKLDKSVLETFQFLWKYLWPKGHFDLKWRVSLAFVCLILAKAVNVYVPFFLKQAVDELSLGTTLLSLPMGLILAYGFARVSTQVFAELRDFFFAKVSSRAQRRVALETFEKLHKLSLRFHLDRQTGGLSRVIERGTRGIDLALDFLTFNIIPTFVELGLVVAVLLGHFDWPFAAITCSTIVIYTVFTFTVTNWRTRFRTEMNKKDSEANTKAIDSLLNYETVKYFGNEEHEARRYDLSLIDYERASVRSQTSLSYLNVGQGVIIGAGLISLMWLSASQVVSGRQSVGDFVLLNTYLLQLYLPLNYLGMVYRETRQCFIDMEKMFELMGESVEVKDPEEPKDLVVGHGEIIFDSVNFSYNSDRPILKNVSFKVQAGKTVAVVGPSGSGKSTIARLLFRFYDVNSGCILIDGQDIRDVSQKSLRQKIGVVPQDTVLFNDSILYNIQYGRVEASFEEVQGAARAAKIADFIESLPEKYKTSVGERGLKLSGGEKQRVAIARTILKNPPILIFDEATSALDSHTEKEIQKSLDEISKYRTTLVIAHRLSTIVDADEILVLKDGQVIERGTHNALISQNGHYKEMWERQQKASLKEQSTLGA